MFTAVKKASPLRRSVAGLAFLTIPLPAIAFELTFPAPASQTLQTEVSLGSYALPIGAFKDGAMQIMSLEGKVSRHAWSLQAKGMTTLQILAPLREQIGKAGFETLFECETSACGGFDFRFGTEIAPEPAMHVDLGDFRYLAAEKNGPDGPTRLAVIVSRSATLGFVQVTEIGPASATLPLVSPAPIATAVPVPPAPQGEDGTPLAVGLADQGSVPLDDLIFGSGAADLALGDYASLDALAAYLRANPANRVALVGHTDASGALAGNVTLSRARAASVRSRMFETYDIPKEQIIAEGVGYLAPRDSNLTEQGRTRNRRVEVMLLVNP